jgi:hypothetical protein
MTKRNGMTQPFQSRFIQAIACYAAIAVASLAPNSALAQSSQANLSTPKAPAGYALKEQVDLGGHMTDVTGSGAMYSTMVNLQSGPRVLGEAFQLHPLSTNKHPLFDSMSAFSSGFGGDPNNYARLDFYRGKLYEFSGNFRRDRQYFDYDLLGNPNIPSGQTMPIGPANAPTGSIPWPQMTQSPFLYNTVRRMTDVSLRVFPVSRVSYRVEYSQNVFEGPSLSPGAGSKFFDPSLGAFDALLEEYQRNSSDDFDGEIDWKPVPATTLSYEEVVDHYKGDSYFVVAPSQYIAQEADGTPVALGDWDSLTPYGSGGVSNYCNTGSMGSGYTSAADYTIFSAPQTPGGKPIINPACDVITKYLRSQPTRILFPTEIFRFQSSSIRNIQMNGDVRYTQANMHLPNYYENFQGLNGQVRTTTFTGNANARRVVTAVDYALLWDATKNVSLSDQVVYSSAQQPGTSDISAGTTEQTPANPYATINYAGPLMPGSNATVEGSPNGTPLHGFFGQNWLTNNATLSWDGLQRATISLTYTYRFHQIAQGIPHNTPLAVGSNTNGTVTIHENGAKLMVALRPSKDWNVDGSLAVRYADNAFTPVDGREVQHYRLHTLYRPRPWLTVTGVYNDMELHNNTNNNQSAVAAGLATYAGPINHVMYSRTGSLGAVVAPNGTYQLEFNYTYSDVYTSTNICYDAAASPTLPGAATASGTACPGASVRGTSYYEFGPARDFENSPTQYGFAAISFHPVRRLQTRFGYTITSTNGSRFYNDARDVAGSLVSTYQTPYVHAALTVRKGWIWSADYHYYGYGEGGPSGAQYCSTANPAPSSPAAVIPCNSTALAGLQTGMTISPAGETSPRNFHANVVTLGMHYEF